MVTGPEPRWLGSSAAAAAGPDVLGREDNQVRPAWSRAHAAGWVRRGRVSLEDVVVDLTPRAVHAVVHQRARASACAFRSQRRRLLPKFHEGLLLNWGCLRFTTCVWRGHEDSVTEARGASRAFRTCPVPPGPLLAIGLPVRHNIA